MTNPIRTAATLATTLALTAAVVSAAPAATPADPREAVVLITTRTASGGVSCSARRGWGGKITAPASRRARRKASSAWPRALAKNSSTSGCQPGATGQSAG